MNFQQGETLLVNKPMGWTSFDVVNKIRYAIQKKLKQKVKVGHAGTLDPLATGLLIICTGKNTKRAEEFQGFDKVYTGTFLLGKTTPSFDLETPFENEQSLDAIREELLHQTAKQFTGIIQQFPPQYSAIKLGGKVAHREARQGNTLELQPRQVSITHFEITAVRLPEVDFQVHCSKGTYIRSLANDFGKALGCGACLAKLVRTQVGEWKLGNAHELTDLIAEIETN